MKTIPTVNVIECSDANIFSVQSLKSFPDTKEGNEAAEQCFIDLCKKIALNVDQELIDTYLDDGVCWVNNSFIALVHSFHKD